MPLVACRRRPKERPPPKALESVVQGGGVACSVDKSDQRAVDGDGPQLQVHFKLCANSGFGIKNP
jgi:hypothetical protein